MHDSAASSFLGSEDGSPSCSSSDEFDYRLPSLLSSQCGGNSAVYFSDGLYPNHEMLTGPRPYGCGSKEYVIDLMVLESGSEGVGAKLSEARMAARRAEEAGQRVDAIRNMKHPIHNENQQDISSRRQLAAQWLQTMVGNQSLPADPTVEDLRVYLKSGGILCKVINKVQPGSVPKVEDPVNSNQLNGALPNYLYYDNVRNFLVAVEDMGLPAFEASDLEKGPMSTNASAKLVDCILALKSYHDWKQGGALGFWRLKSPNDTGSCVTSSRHLNHSKYPNSRRKWMQLSSDQQSLDDTSLSSSPDQLGNNFLGFHKDGRASFDDTVRRLDPGGQECVDGRRSEDRSASPVTSASTSTWLQDIRHKFSEVLQVKAKRTQETPIATEGYGGGPTMAYDHNAPSQSLLNLISAIIGDKPAEEVPLLVEFMLRKIMEEFERHLLNQRNQVTKAINPSLSIAKMKSALKDIMVREEKLASQNMVLGSGTQEEVKNVEEDIKRLKEVDMNEKRNTNKPLDDNNRLLHLENAKREMEVEAKERMSMLQTQLTESKKKIQEMEYQSSKLKGACREKDNKWQKSLSKLLKDFKDLRWWQLDAKEEILRMQFDWKEQVKKFEEELQTLVAAASGYHKVLAENRQLYNEVQDLKGNIRVYCRVRPFLTKDPTRQTTIDYLGENGELVLANPSKPAGKESRRSFMFNRCFDTKSLQEEVFLDTHPLIRSVLDGFNVCIFAYGQTGSGKTFTMSGPTNITPTNWGVNYRALNDLFQITQSRLHVFRYEIGVQMLEIYNEQVRDLLVTDGSHKRLEIRNNSQLNGLNVPDANIMPVKSTDDVIELMRLGQKNRAVGSTSLNDRSSRSHSVVTVHVQGTELDSGNIFRGSLHLVDLAGSERVDKSEVTGDRLKEAQHINKSLSALGDVISALAQKNGHVPYRNSKLTQLLQDALGGQAKTLMFVHISPDAESFGETMSTLKFAERVATVELGAARSNKESGEIQTLKDQVNQLKDVVAKNEVEIGILHTTIERFEKVDDSSAKTAKPKPTNASKPRRRPSNEPQPPKNRKTTTTMENGNANAEARQSMRSKHSGGKKTSTTTPANCGVVLSSAGHVDAEHEYNSPEHLESACSPLDSPTGSSCTTNKAHFEVSEDVGAVNNVFEKLQLLKSRRRRWIAATMIGNHNHGGEQQLFVDKPEMNGRYHDINAAAGAVDTGRGARNNSHSVVHRTPSNTTTTTTTAAAALEPANGSFETILLETIGGSYGGGLDDDDDDVDVDVDVDDDDEYRDEPEGVFEARGACIQDVDTASLYSDSGMSAEADGTSGSSHVDVHSKAPVRSSASSRPHHHRKGMLQREVSPSPVITNNNTSRASPNKGDRKPSGGLVQVRPRKQKLAGPAGAPPDKPPPKRHALLTANPNQEVEHASSRRSTVGATSLTTWR